MYFLEFSQLKLLYAFVAFSMLATHLPHRIVCVFLATQYIAFIIHIMKQLITQVPAHFLVSQCIIRHCIRKQSQFCRCAVFTVISIEISAF